MAVLAALGGLLLILLILWDGFETVVLPRRVTRPVRLTRLFYHYTWKAWSAMARRMHIGIWRENYLSLYGPLSLLLLLALWAVALVVGFALLQWGLGSEMATPEGTAGLGVMLYASGTTFFTLGLGDVIPRTSLGQAIPVAEVGVGFGFLALVISYLPVLYQAFSRREVSVSLLDARAGSPPTAAELLRRHCESGSATALGQLLLEWERWSAELLESHLSYPVLAYYRSQHERQSWLAALTTILDVCILASVGIDTIDAAVTRSARLAFAMARHAAVDLSQVFGTTPRTPAVDRLPPADLERLRSALIEVGLPLRVGRDADSSLAELRQLYEPYVDALSSYLLMPLPSWLPPAGAEDDWQTSAWELSTPRRPAIK